MYTSRYKVVAEARGLIVLSPPVLFELLKSVMAVTDVDESKELFIIPSRRAFSSLDEFEQAILLGQKLLTDKIPVGHATDADEARYKYFTERASEAPFLTLDRTGSDKRSWERGGIKVMDALNTFLPEEIREELKHLRDQATDMQSIVSKKSFWRKRDKDNREVTEFAIVRLVQWDKASLEVYYVKICASYVSEPSWLLFSTNTHQLELEYYYTKFSILAGPLQAVYKKNKGVLENEISQWMDTKTVVSAR